MMLRGRHARRIAEPDEQAIDVEALSINPYWYSADAAKLLGIPRLDQRLSIGLP